MVETKSCENLMDLKKFMKDIWKKVDLNAKQDLITKIRPFVQNRSVLAPENLIDEEIQFFFKELENRKSNEETFNKTHSERLSKIISFLTEVSNDFTTKMEEMKISITNRFECKKSASEFYDKLVGEFRNYPENEQIEETNKILKQLMLPLTEEGLHEKEFSNKLSETTNLINKLYMELEEKLEFLDKYEKEAFQSVGTNLLKTFKLDEIYNVTRILKRKKKINKIISAVVGSQKQKCAVLETNDSKEVFFSYSQNFNDNYNHQIKFDALALPGLEKYQNNPYSIQFSPLEDNLMILMKDVGLYILKFINKKTPPTIHLYNEYPYKEITFGDWISDKEIMLAQNNKLHYLDISENKNLELPPTYSKEISIEKNKSISCLLVEKNDLYLGMQQGGIKKFTVICSENKIEIKLIKEWKTLNTPISLSLVNNYWFIGYGKTISVKRSDGKDEMDIKKADIENLEYLSISPDCSQIVTISETKIMLFEIKDFEFKRKLKIKYNGKTTTENEKNIVKQHTRSFNSGLMNWNKNVLVFFASNGLFKLDLNSTQIQAIIFHETSSPAKLVFKKNLHQIY